MSSLGDFEILLLDILFLVYMVTQIYKPKIKKHSLLYCCVYVYMFQTEENSIMAHFATLSCCQ